MSTRTPPQFSSSTTIYIKTEPGQLTELNECLNHTAEVFMEQNPIQWQIIGFISALMCGCLLIVLIVSSLVFAAGKTERLEKHIHAADILRTQVTYQPQDPNKSGK
ncbi:uncharacterized protein si:dkey-103k4.2 [Danio aesculapii]|uniref:uncharacterized protein si:dkey-103k4.2 n=1 Tax=Danio aesculapii TaxID=1142201 RepID=UPI0024C017AF|nr:uncharacterized protein si:dkey-103k4.2 [Danio aesculapii]